ncbi:acetyl-CoA carboxylase biotin carboxyl carrier protein subunit [Bacteroidota bacterium]
MKDLILNIDGTEFSAVYKNDNPNILVNGNPYQVDLMKQSGKNIYSFSVNNRMCQIEFELNELGKSQVTLDGLIFDIDITDETKKLLNQYIKQTGAGDAAGAGVIKAPMPGLIVKILVEKGQKINKGDKVIIIEAMKMENVLQSTISGVIKSVKVHEGQAVDKDAVMVEIEADS